MFLRYFSKRFIKWEDIDILKQGRKKQVQNKIINHGGNFIEVTKMEKAMSVVDRDDPILILIEKHLVAAMSDVWFDDHWRPKNYEFDTLPSKLKKYMKQIDELAFDRSYRSGKVPKEVYDRRVDKLLKVMPEYTDDEFMDYVLLGKPIPNTIYRNAKESARRAYKKVNGILKTNINKFEMFVTLTFAPEENKEKHLKLNGERREGEIDIKFDYVEGKDFEKVKIKFSQKMNDFSKKIKAMGYDFQYLAVWELQRNGAYHFHLLTTRIPKTELYKVPSWLDYDHKKDTFDKGYGLMYWNYGKSDVQEIKNHAQISTYISKYILKSFYNLDSLDACELYKGQKKYFATRGLDRSEEEYLESSEVNNILKEFDLIEDEPYEREYINPYNNGIIKNNIYTLIDKKKKSPEIATKNG